MKRNLLAISLMTMAGLYGMLAAIIILAFVVLDLPVTLGIGISVIILIIQFLIAPWVNDLIFKAFYKVKFDYEIPEYLQDFIEETCEKYDMMYPKVGFINDGAPNAFTYGRTKNDARIVITRGIFDLLDEEEVKTVVAHELGHAKNYDMLFMTVAQLVPLVLYYVYELLIGSGTNTKSSSSSDGDKADYAAIIGLIAYVLYLLSQYIILWLSRTREYCADSFALEETKNPTALAKALIKIGFGLARGDKEERSKVSSGNALGISNGKHSKGMAISSYNGGGVTKENVINAMKWEKWNVWAKLNELSSTHPLTSKRILAISERCPEFGQEPYIAFNEEQPESYVDDFFKELAILLMPWISLIVTIILMFTVGEENISKTLGISGIVLFGTMLIQLGYTHKNKGYKETTVENLLSEVKVSNVTSIPCILEGTIIGRGNPGCVFNEDFVIKDETGIMFLDYNQPLVTIEKLFAIFRSKEYFDKKVRIKGWYRRSLSPYVEVHSIEIDGKIKKCHTYATAKIILAILLAVSIVAALLM